MKMKGENMNEDTKSELNCGNCDEQFEIDDSGDRIQPCPNCDSPEMVKTLRNIKIK